MRPALANFLRNPTPFSILTRSTRPLLVAHVQTDGSFRNGVSCTAALLKTPTPEDYTLLTTHFGHKDSQHSEWASVLDGILFSAKKDQGAIELDNDCLGIIKGLTQRRPPTDKLASHLYGKIFREVRRMDHVGVRWIPREMNRADELFRR